MSTPIESYIDRPQIAITPKKVKIKDTVNTYKISFMLYVFLIAGIGIGAYFSVTTDNHLYENLDFLFTSNISAKLKQSIHLTFISSYASSCIFLIASFLMGLSLWGSMLLPFLSFFKGFGIGIIASYLYQTYELDGAVYYIGVILPCIFISVIALIMLQDEAFQFSFRLFLSLIKKDGIPNSILRNRFTIYIKKCGICLFITLLSSMLDVGLTLLFGHLFNF